MSDRDIEKLLSKDESSLTINDVSIKSEDIYIVYHFHVCCLFTADASLKDKGLIREITSRIQKLRKEVCFILIIISNYFFFFIYAKVISTDEIIVYYSVKPQTSEIARITSEQGDKIEAILQNLFLPMKRDTIADSILLRVTILPNAQACVMCESLFVGEQCTTLIERNK
ncbi:unnamed protein product, partial [Rotaria sordida]